MRVVKGSKIIDISVQGLNNQLQLFEKCVLDIGTGDGRFVYENALKDKDTLFIGVDPAQNQMMEFSAKANRKRLKNVLFVIGSIELLPSEIKEIADKVYILFPWGSLLEHVVNPDDIFLETLVCVLKKGGEVEMVFGYSPELEPSETNRLGLLGLDLKMVKEKILPKYTKELFNLISIEPVTSEDVSKIASSWAKTLILTKERPLFRLCLQSK